MLCGGPYRGQPAAARPSRQRNDHPRSGMEEQADAVVGVAQALAGRTAAAGLKPPPPRDRIPGVPLPDDLPRGAVDQDLSAVLCSLIPELLIHDRSVLTGA